MEPLTEEQASEIMKKYGYDAVSKTTTTKGEEIITTINYTRSTDIKLSDHFVSIYAEVNLNRRDVKISMVELKLLCYLTTTTFSITHPRFTDFENKILKYAKACVMEDKGSMFSPEEPEEPKFKFEFDGNHLYLIEGDEKTTYIKLEKDETKKDKKTIEDRKMAFWEELKPIAKQKGISKEFALKFYRYWTEHGPNDKTFRKELQKKFNISMRLNTFLENEKEWKGQKQTYQEKTAQVQNVELKKKNSVIDKNKLF